MKTIRYETEGSLAVITLNRPEKRNALSSLMIVELTESLMRAATDSTCRVILIQAEGKAFCAGMDLENLEQATTQSFEANLADSNRLAELFRCLHTSPKPVITAVNGPAYAGGCGLATIADFTLATPEAKFAYTEVRIGFIPALVSVFLVYAVGEKRARDLLLSGRIFPAAEALQLGLVTEIVEAEKLPARARELAATLAANSPRALAATKRLLQETLAIDLQAACKANARARQTPDCKEGVRAFLENRKPNWS